jgi:WD40 repeat protein/biotin carboxyl carrier protein
MLRWLALCVVLCAGAVLLVALATQAFFPHTAPPNDTTLAPVEAAPADDNVQAGEVGEGLGRDGSIVLSNARLTPVEHEDAPSQHDGTVFVIGTDDPADPDHPGRALPAKRVAFLVILIESGDPVADPSHEKEWLYLQKRQDSTLPKDAFTRAQRMEMEKQAAADKQPAPKYADGVYRRWHEGDPLLPKKVEVAFERKVFYELNEGDWVKQGELVAMVDPTVEVNDVALKVNKIETAESEYIEAGKTKEEAERRASESERLFNLKSGIISLDAYYADVLNAKRYAEEEKGKFSAFQGAIQELSASLTILKLHEVRASIPGVIKTIYKHTGEAVKNLDPILQIQNPLQLRVEGLAGAQDAPNLDDGQTVFVQPTRPVSPDFKLSGHQAEVKCVAVSRPSADGRQVIVSGGADGTARFWWDWKSKQPKVVQMDARASVLAAACTGPKAAGNLALIGDADGVGRIFDLDRLLPPPNAAVAGMGDAAHLLQARPLKLSERHKGAITCAAFSPDGLFCATGGEDRAIRLWKVADGKLLLTLNAAHKAAVTSLQFAQPEGQPLQLVSAGGDETFGVWKLDNFDHLDAPAKPDAKRPAPAAVRVVSLPYRSGDVAEPGVSADGRSLLFDHGNELRIVSLESHQLEGGIQASDAAVNFTTMALFAPDGATVLTNASDGRLQLWRRPAAEGDALKRALELRQFVWPTGPATCGAFDPNRSPNFVVTGSRDGYVLIWDMPKPEEVQRPPLSAKLSLVDRSLEAGARQLRVWADLPELKDEKEWRRSGLTPGGTATLIVPPPAVAVSAK